MYEIIVCRFYIGEAKEKPSAIFTLYFFVLYFSVHKKADITSAFVVYSLAHANRRASESDGK